MNRTTVKDELVQILRGQLYDLWKKEDLQFLTTLVEDILKQKRLLAQERKHAAANHTSHPEVYIRNLHHLATTLGGEVARRKIKFAFRCRKVFLRVLRAGIKIMATEALS